MAVRPVPGLQPPRRVRTTPRLDWRDQNLPLRTPRTLEIERIVSKSLAFRHILHGVTIQSNSPAVTSTTATYAVDAETGLCAGDTSVVELKGVIEGLACLLHHRHDGCVHAPSRVWGMQR